MPYVDSHIKIGPTVPEKSVENWFPIENDKDNWVAQRTGFKSAFRVVKLFLTPNVIYMYGKALKERTT